MFGFYSHALVHACSERQYFHIMSCIRRARCIDDADYERLIRIKPAFLNTGSKMKELFHSFIKGGNPR